MSKILVSEDLYVTWRSLGIVCRGTIFGVIAPARAWYTGPFRIILVTGRLDFSTPARRTHPSSTCHSHKLLGIIESPVWTLAPLIITSPRYSKIAEAAGESSQLKPSLEPADLFRYFDRPNLPFDYTICTPCISFCLYILYYILIHIMPLYDSPQRYLIAPVFCKGGLGHPRVHAERAEGSDKGALCRGGDGEVRVLQCESLRCPSKTFVYLFNLQQTWKWTIPCVQRKWFLLFSGSFSTYECFREEVAEEEVSGVIRTGSWVVVGIWRGNARNALLIMGKSCGQTRQIYLEDC